MFKGPTKYSEYIQDVPKSIDYILKRVNAVTVADLQAVTNAGATTTLPINTGGITSDYFQLDTAATPTLAPGMFGWDDAYGTADLRLKGNNVTLQLGQELLARVVNKTGADLLESQYKVVRVRIASEGGAQGQRLAVVLAQGDNDPDSATTLGLVTENIANNQEGFITIFGNVNNINTTGSLQGETWVDGDVLYLSPTIPGAITKVKPVAPQHTVIIGYVVYAHNNNGKIFVKVDNGYELDELHNVLITSPANNDLLQYDSTQQVWKNVAPSIAVPTPTLAQVTTAGNTTTNSIIVGATQYKYLGNVVGEIRGNANTYNNLDLVYGASWNGSQWIDELGAYGSNKLTLGNDGIVFYTGSNQASGFPVNYTERMRMAGTGNFLIGTTTDAGYKLDVDGTLRATGIVYADSTINQPANFGNKLLFMGSGNYSKIALADGTNWSLDYHSGTTVGNVGYHRFYTGSTSGWVERMRIDNNGNVGIGTSNPLYKLHVTDSAGDIVYILASTGQSAIIGATGSGTNRMYIGYSPGAENISITSSGVVRLNSITSGNVLIGTTTDAGYKLDVNGIARVGDSGGSGQLYIKGFAGTGQYLYLDDGSKVWSLVGATNYSIQENGTSRLTIKEGGNVGIGTTTPTAKLQIKGTGDSSVWVTTDDFNTGSNTGSVVRVGTRSSTGNTQGWIDVLNSGVSSYGNLILTGFGGNVLIGTTTDAGYKLDVVGADSRFNGVRVGVGAGGVGSNTVVGNGALNANLGAGTGFSVTAIGYQALQTSTSGYQNTALGYQALRNLTTASDCVAIGASAATNTIDASANTAVGSESLLNNTYGQSNTAVGYRSLYSSIIGMANVAFGRQALNFNTGSYNTAVGYQAGFNNTSSVELTAIGYFALRSNTTGGQNTAVGSNALYSNTTGNTNSALGYNTLYNNTIGTNNSAVGHLALFSNTTGNTNSAFGYLSLTTNTTGSNNVAVGVGALRLNTTGGVNTAVGVNSLQANTTGIENAAFGVDSLRSNTTGSSNTSVGANALFSSTASNNTALGYQAGYAGVANTTGANNIFIGYQATGVSATESNRTWIGNSSTTSTWVGGNLLVGTTTNAGYKLDVNGTARFTTGTAGTGIYLTSTVSGNSGTLTISPNATAIGTQADFTISSGNGTRLFLGGNYQTLITSTVGLSVSNGVGIGGNLTVSGGGSSQIYSTDFVLGGIANTSASIYFTSSGYTESKILWRVENLGSYGISNLHLCINGDSATTRATISDAKVSFLTNGNVGLGTTNPTDKFHIVDNTNGNKFARISAGGTDASAAWVAQNDQVDNIVYRVFGSAVTGSQMGQALARSASLIANLGGTGKFLIGSYSGTDLIFGTSDQARMRLVDSTGNFLIGTMTDNGNKLTVSGNIDAQGYKVNNVLGYTGIFNVPTNPPGQQNIDIQGGIVINIF